MAEGHVHVVNVEVFEENEANGEALEENDNYLLKSKILNAIAFIRKIKKKRPDKEEIFKYLTNADDIFKDLEFSTFEQVINSLLFLNVLERRLCGDAESFFLVNNQDKLGDRVLNKLEDFANDIKFYINHTATCTQETYLHEIQKLSDNILKGKTIFLRVR